MESLVSILPQIGVGGIAVAGMVYMTIKHNDAMEKQQTNFLAALEKQDKSFRDLETSVRSTLTDQLTKNSVIMSDVTKMLTKLARHFEE